MRHATRDYEFVVVGGGMAGIAAAVAAARRGVRTALIHDRAVLGGNAGKEVRIGLHGAENGQNNRYFRETGLMEELRLENLYRNPLGNAELWDALLLETVLSQENLDLYLNSAVTEVDLSLELPREGVQDPQPRIVSVGVVTLTAELRWTFQSPLFADCTDNGTIAYLAGADFRTGREARHEFQESLADDKSRPFAVDAAILCTVRDTGRPVPFILPDWAVGGTHEPVELTRQSLGSGHELWRFTWSGECDAPYDSERVKSQLLGAVYGAFDREKNGPHRGTAMVNHILEWVGMIPGELASRRIIGDYILAQHDLQNPPEFEDAVAVGGASFEFRPAANAHPTEPAGFRFHLPGMYNIPLRSLYSCDVGNLFVAGRSISATYIAHGSIRAPLTCGATGEAVGTAAAHCTQRECPPAALLEDGGVYSVQQDLLLHDHPILGVRAEDPLDLARTAAITESSVAEASLDEQSGEITLTHARALMLPLAGKLDGVSLRLRSEESVTLPFALHAPNAKGNYVPGPVLVEGSVNLLPTATPEWVDLPLDMKDAEPGFYWLVLPAGHPGVRVSTTHQRLVGVLTYGSEPGWHPDSGQWTPGRPQRNPFSPWRKCGINLCFRTDAWLPAFYAGEQVANGYSRPYRTPNIWVSGRTEFSEPEWLDFHWDDVQQISSIYLFFNTDLDRDLRNLWHEYDERVVPECVRTYRVLYWTGSAWEVVVEESDNHHRWKRHEFPTTSTTRLRLEILSTHGDPRAQVYEVRIYGPEGPWYAAG